MTRFDGDAWDDDDEEGLDRPPASSRRTTGIGAGSAGQHVRAYLRELSKDELIAFVERLATQDATVRQALAEQVETASGPTAELLRGARANAARIAQRRGNLDAWREHVQALRERERRKYRLREILDSLLRRYARP